MDEKQEAPTTWSKEKIAKVVAEKLSSRYPGWENVNVEEIQIENVSGLGGNLTYHVRRMFLIFLR